MDLRAQGAGYVGWTKYRRAPDLSILITAYSCFQLCQALLEFCHLGGGRRGDLPSTSLLLQWEVRSCSLLVCLPLPYPLPTALPRDFFPWNTSLVTILKSSLKADGEANTENETSRGIKHSQHPLPRCDPLEAGRKVSRATSPLAPQPTLHTYIHTHIHPHILWQLERTCPAQAENVVHK